MSHEQVILLQFLGMLALIILASKLAGHVSKRYLRLPVVFGEILIGVLLGPSLLNVFNWPIFAGSTFLSESIRVLAQFGVLLLMFIAGLETNLDELRRVGKTAFWTALGGVLLPLSVGTTAALVFRLPFAEAIFIGAVLTATSVSISAQTLMELGSLNSREGMTILGAAVIDDVMGIIILSFVIAFDGVHESGGVVKLSDTIAALLAPLLGLSPDILGIVAVILLMTAYFIITVLIASRGFTPLLRLAERMQASYAIPAAALLLMLLYAVSAELFGQVAAITGAYIAGIYLARTPYSEKILHAIHPFTYAVFVPIFFMGIGLGANIQGILHGGWQFALVIIGVALFTKIIGCGLGARWTGFSRAEALRVGVGMISRGEVGLIVAAAGLQSHVIEADNYAALVLMVLVSTMVTPVLLRLTFPHEREMRADVFESVVTVETSDEESRR